jgi:RNA polymerase sigma factor (sigma-70 family)
MRKPKAANILADDLLDALALKAKGGDQEAISQVIDSLQGIVGWMAGKMIFGAELGGLEYEDVVHELVAAILKAVKIWEAGRGTLFRSYATQLLKNECVRMIRQRGWPIRLPPHAYRMVKVLKQKTDVPLNRMTPEYVRELLKDDEVMLDGRGKRGVSKTVAAAVCLAWGFKRADDFPLGMIPEEDLGDANWIEEALSSLDSVSRDILERSLGLRGKRVNVRTLAAEYGICPYRARVIRREALDKIGNLLRDAS